MFHAVCSSFFYRYVLPLDLDITGREDTHSPIDIKIHLSKAFQCHSCRRSWEKNKPGQVQIKSCSGIDGHDNLYIWSILYIYILVPRDMYIDSF